VSRRRAWERNRGSLAAAIVFGVALTSIFHGLAGQDPLVHRPHRLFDLEQCHPIENALALGEPMIVDGVLGIPAQLVSGDPLVTFTWVLIVVTLLGALSLYLLIKEWTGLPAAGIVAGLLYGFHAAKIGDVVHFFVWDLSWAALGLLFARRLFERSRWRDALGLGACCAMQLMGSIYPVLAAGAIALPGLVWLSACHGFRTLRIGPVLLVGAVVSGTALLVYGPYLAMHAEGTLWERPMQVHLAWAWLRPGTRFSLGWVLPALALAGIALAGRRAMGRLHHARWAILAGGVLCMALATGGTEGDLLRSLLKGEPAPPRLPNLWEALVAIVPALQVVRFPAALFAGAHLALAILAGLGAAALLRLVPTGLAPWAAAGLIALAYVDTLRPAALGFEPRISYATVPLRPSDESLEFFHTLEGLGNTGPLFEVSSAGYMVGYKSRASHSLLLTAYHHRRTSSCLNSFLGEVQDELVALGKALPDRAAVSRLRELGFTTVILHHGRMLPGTLRKRRSFDVAARHRADLSLLHRSTAHSAYALNAEPALTP